MCAAAGAVIAVGAAFAAHLLHQAPDNISAVVAGSLAAGISLGAGAARAAYSPSILEWFERTPDAAVEPITIEGVLQDDAVEGPFGISLTLRVFARVVRELPSEFVEPLEGGVRLSVAGALARQRVHEWRAGRTVRLTASVRPAAIYVNPGVPDDGKALARRGIVLVGSVKSGALVEVVGRGTPLDEAAGACRAWARLRIAESVGTWSRRSGGIAAAILLGDRTGLTQDDERRLQDAGTYHVIAISGGNIAILTAILLTVFRLLRARPRVAEGATILLLLFYGSVVSAAPSVHRAITAAIVYLAARLLDQRGPAVNILATAAVLAVAISPVTVFDPGFLLSFGATLGILAGVPSLMRFLPPQQPRGLRACCGLLAATVAAEIVLAPIAAALFSRVTAAGILLNFAAIPLMSLVQIGTLLVLLTGGVSSDAASAAAFAVHAAAEGLVESARFVDLAPWLVRDVVPPAWWLLVIYYGSVIAAYQCLVPRRAAISVAAVCVLAICIGLPLTSRDAVPVREGRLRIAFLDVGQGDATLVTLPDGRSLLVDAGGFPIPAIQESESGYAAGFDVGERVVAPALRALRVRRLDTLVITHGDPDHIGGGRSVLRLFKPRAVWEGVPVPRHPDSAALAADADAIGAARQNVVRGGTLRVRDAQIRVLHPPVADWERQRVRNEDSIVLDIRLGGVSVLLPGDIGLEGESAVASIFEPASIVVLKAPHHGSATSSTPAFLEALNPSAVIVSAGRANRFGHPARSVVARYRERGTLIFSTAEDGAVILETDGREVEIRGWTGRSVRLTSRQLSTSNPQLAKPR